MALLKNNSIETCTLNVAERKPEASITSQLLMPGHRTEPRTVAFSSDNTAVLSASADSLRVWNRYFVNFIYSLSHMPFSLLIIIIIIKNNKFNIT